MTSETREPPHYRRRIPVVLAAVLAVLSFAAAAFSGVSWAMAANDDGVRTARTREVVLHQAERRLVELNTIDHARAAECLDRWQQQVTGPLADEVGRNRDNNIQAIRDSRTTTTSRVLGAAVTELDVHGGHAKAIAALEMTVAPQGTEPIVKRSRISAELTRTGQDWKLGSVQVVGLSG